MLVSMWSVFSFVFVQVRLHTYGVWAPQNWVRGEGGFSPSHPRLNPSLALSRAGWGLGVVGFWLRGALPPRVLGGMFGQPRRSSQEAWGQAEARLWQVWLWDMGGNSHMHSHTLLLQDAMPPVLCQSIFKFITEIQDYILGNENM